MFAAVPEGAFAGCDSAQPKRAAVFDAFRNAIIEADGRSIGHVDAFKQKGLSPWDYAITTRHAPGTLGEMSGLDREMMLEHFPNTVSEIIRENTFVELWPSYLDSLECDQLNGLFPSILLHREELSLTGVFIEFPGTWMFERGRLLRDRRA